VLTERGLVRVELPRDRDDSFAPILIPKHERRFTGMDDRIIAMYARGRSVRDTQAFLAESYGTEVSPDFISSVTDEVMAETIAWQNRPLEAMYPVMFSDALRVNIRDDGRVSNKAVYLALAVQADGQRDVLGLRVEQTESVPGHTARLGRRLEGPGQRHRHGLPTHDGTDLYRASDPQQPRLRRLEGQQGRGRRLACLEGTRPEATVADKVTKSGEKAEQAMTALLANRSLAKRAGPDRRNLGRRRQGIKPNSRDSA
jgi:hypothetical protein